MLFGSTFSHLIDILMIGILFLAAFTNKGKFLLAARRYRNGAHTEYIISLDPDDSSQGSNAYVGKLRYVFLIQYHVHQGAHYTLYLSGEG